MEGYVYICKCKIILKKTLICITSMTKELFYINLRGDNYQDLLRQMCIDATKKGYATKKFKDSVKERETRFETIYKNGVAGPHPMKLDAIRDSISVAVFNPPYKYKDREINDIFLINLQKGNIMLHKRLSNLLIASTKGREIQKSRISSNI